MESVAIMLSLIGTAGFFAFLAAQVKIENVDNKWNTAVKTFFNTVSFTLVLLLPFAGLQVASNQGWSSLETIMGVALVPTVFSYMIYLFYLVMMYAQDVFNYVKSDKIDRR